MKGFPTVAAEGVCSSLPIAIQSLYSSAAQGDGYFHIMDAIIDGKPTEVVSHRGDWRFWNARTGEVLFDWNTVGTPGGVPITFYQPPASSQGAVSPSGMTPSATYTFSDPVTNHQLGMGSYWACEKWFNPVTKTLEYYYGGYFKVYPSGVTEPSPIGGTADQTYKHSFVLMTRDHKTFYPVMITTNDVPYSSSTVNSNSNWVGECSALIGTPGGLYISLGDGQRDTGVYVYSGAVNSDGVTPVPITLGNPATQHSTDLPAALYTGSSGYTVSGFVQQDSVVYGFDLSASGVRTFFPLTGTTSGTASVSGALRGAASGTYSPPSSSNWGGIGTIGRMSVIGQNGGLVIGSIGGASFVAVPFLPVTNPGVSGISRMAGWRSPMVNVGTGLVFAVNSNMVATDGDAQSAYLVYYSGAGKLRILDEAAMFHGIRVSNGRLFYSASTLELNSVYSQTRNQIAVLKSIPLEQIQNWTPPPFGESFNYASYTTTAGALGTQYFGVYPTSGYSRGELLVESGTTGTLTLTRIAANKSNSVGTNGASSSFIAYSSTVSLTGGTPVTQDLSSYLKHGDLLALSFSTSAAICGRMCMEP